MTAETSLDHDRLFKELISTFFEEFMLLFFPEAYEHIDFQKLGFLSEELFSDVTAGDKYRVDLLVETKLKEEDGLIIIHVEPQSYIQGTFNERMFIYFSRLHEKYRRKILPIAIFSYDTLRDEPNEFSVDFPFVNVLRFHYLSVQLKKQNWRNYIRHDNPVAAALLSKMGYTKNERIEVKKEFFKMLIRLQLDRARETLITGFFETYLQLDEQEEQKFKEEVKSMNPKEGEKIMEIITSYERKGREEGRKEGQEKGRKKEKIGVAKKLLQKGMGEAFVEEVTGLTLEEIEKMNKESE